MKTATIEKYPLLSEVPGKPVANGHCPYLKAYCSTCMYAQAPDDYWITGDDRHRCTYYTKDEMNRVLV